MGYELDKLMAQYGVTTPGRVGYSGAPAALGANATPEQRAANEEQRAADLKAYNQYRDDYAARIRAVPTYDEKQYGGSGGATHATRLAAPTYTPIPRPAPSGQTQSNDGLPLPSGGDGVGEQAAPYTPPNRPIDISQYWDPITGQYKGNWPGIDAYNAQQFKRGGNVRALMRKYNMGGVVKRFAEGGLQETTPISPAATDLMALMDTYMSKQSPYAEELRAASQKNEQENKAFADMLANAVKNTAQPPDKSELYFRLAAAFGSPTKTGKFTENLGLASKEMADYSKDQRAAKKAEAQMGLEMGLEAQKLKVAGARDELNTLRALASEENKDKRAMLQEYIKSGRPQSEAGKLAIDSGLKAGTPEYNKFVSDYVQRKLESGDAYKEIMAGIAQGNLELRKAVEARQAENATKLTPAEVKLKAEAETNIGGIDDALMTLQRAYNLNPYTFDGTLAAGAQQLLLEQTNPNDKRVLATREQTNLLSAGGIAKLRASFGGNPTEGERSALLDLEGIDAKSKEERARIMQNTYRLLKQRRTREQKRLNEISAGLYRETEQSTPQELQ